MSPAHNLHLRLDLIVVGLCSEELYKLGDILWEIN
jgi:hypothetical protein